MIVRHLGHSSFRLKGKETSVVMDPFDSKRVGLDYPRVNAEIVTVSHDHFDHNQVERVGGTSKRKTPFVIDRPGEYEVEGVSVIGIRTWHDDRQGKERGENLVFVVGIDGIFVAHLGDLGHELTDKQVAAMGSVDVLLVPVGGVYTIGPQEAGSVIERLSPAVAIPMHYRQKGMGADFSKLATVEEFLEKAGLGESERKHKLKVTRASLPEELEVVVLEE